MARKRIETPEKCLKCGRFIPGTYRNQRCIAFNPLIINCSSFTSDRGEVIKTLKSLKEKCKNTKNSAEALARDIKALERVYALELRDAYYEDTHRGSKGSNSESDSNNKTSLKQKMKDNRALETKPNSKERSEYYEALKNFEEEKGVKLDKLQPNDGITRRKVDSYLVDEEAL